MQEVLSAADVQVRLEDRGALWRYKYGPGGSIDPLRPHALLTSGNHSDGVCDVSGAMTHIDLLKDFAGALVGRLRIVYSGRVDWVVGSDHGSRALVTAIGLSLRARCDSSDKGPNNTQTWNRSVIGPNETVLHVEDLITTASTFQSVRAGIRAAHKYPIKFVPFAFVVVRRGNIESIDGSRVVSLLDLRFNEWALAECPLCAAGSQALRPKESNNWALLNVK